MIQDSMLTSPSSVGKWAREMENSVFLLMQQLKGTKYYKESGGKNSTSLSLTADTEALKWIVILLAFTAPLKELQAWLYISQNHPVRGGDPRIHIKQEEIKARRLATYPDSHAHTTGRAGNSQRLIYPMTCGLDGWMATSWVFVGHSESSWLSALKHFHYLLVSMPWISTTSKISVWISYCISTRTPFKDSINNHHALRVYYVLPNHFLCNISNPWNSPGR